MLGLTVVRAQCIIRAGEAVLPGFLLFFFERCSGSPSELAIAMFWVIRKEVDGDFVART